MEYFSFLTPLGRMAGAADRKLFLLDFRETDDPPPSSDLARATEKQVLEYFEGRRRIFELPVGEEGTEFQKRVWQVLRSIPWGETRTYARVAELAGCPGGARAAGSACGKNPVLLITPCHRVLGGKGIGGFRSGTEIKKALLALEGHAWA